MKKLIIIGSSLVVCVALFLGGFYITGYWGFCFTDSMYPTITSKNLIYTNPFQTPKIGDIMEYRCLNKEKCPNTYDWLIAHRLTKIDENGCMTIVGDNPKYNWASLPCFMPDDIVIRGVVHKLF